MSERSKIIPAEKIKAVEDYLTGERSLSQIMYEFGISHQGFFVWVMLYKSMGAKGLQTRTHNKVYPMELKIAAVNDYRNGQASLMDICAKYGITSTAILRR